MPFYIIYALSFPSSISFSPSIGTPSPYFLNIVFNHLEGRGIILYFPEPLMAVGTCAGSHLLAYLVVGRRIAQDNLEFATSHLWMENFHFSHVTRLSENI